MPTGYTSGILDGEINTFEQFAKRCMRAFGATIHMRDEPLDKEYEPRKPSDYHKNKIQEIDNEIKKIESLSDEEIKQLRSDELRGDIKRHKESIARDKKNIKKLKRMLEDVHGWNPPTEEHESFKQFMVQQLEKTIEFDGVLDWQKEELAKCEEKITSLSGRYEREAMLEKLKKDLEYHKEEHQKEVTRCKEANEWADQLMKSI